MEKLLLQKLGLLGIVSFLSYIAALSSFYNVCEVLCTMMVCVGVQGKKTKLLRTGIYLLTAMEMTDAGGSTGNENRSLGIFRYCRAVQCVLFSDVYSSSISRIRSENQSL